MPKAIKRWGIWEVGVAFDSKATGLFLGNFLATTTQMNGKLYLERTPPSEAVPELLHALWEDTLPSDLDLIPVGFFSNPKLDYRLLYAFTKPAYDSMCLGLTDTSARDALSFYREMASGLQKLTQDKYWEATGGSSTATFREAADALQSYAEEYGSVLQIMGASCRSKSFGEMRTVQPHLKQAKDSQRKFVAAMKELGIDASKSELKSKALEGLDK